LRQEFFVAAQLNRRGPFGVFDAVLDRHSGRTAHCQIAAHSTLLWAYCSTHFANQAPLDSDHSLKRRFFLSSPIVRSRLKSHDTRPSKGKNEIDTSLRLLVAVSLFAVHPNLRAQSATATLSGSVTDPTGAAGANAKVTLQNSATNIRRATAPNSAARVRCS
jgi:hypothetical protein